VAQLVNVPRCACTPTNARGYRHATRLRIAGVVTATRVFWPFLLTADQAAIVNTSSVAAFFPAAGGNCNPYAVSKFAVRGFSEHLETDCRVMAPHITVSCVHPGAINTEIIRKNANLEAVDMRFLKPVLTTSDYNNLMAIQEPERSAAALEIVGGAFEKWGHSAKEAADMIVDGVVARKSRIMVGWDAVFLDLWVRAFPRIFVSPLGRLVSMGSSTVARHLVKPAIVCAVGAYAGYRWHGGSKL
jgi:NAD(P)-dependent dehydrogenase (short-subunit alcohol dehydrogenase family)